MTQPKLLDTVDILLPLSRDGLRPTEGYRLLQVKSEAILADPITDRVNWDCRRSLRRPAKLSGGIL